MAAEDGFERAIQALLDAQPLAGDAWPAGDGTADAIRLVDTIARAHRQAILGREFEPDPLVRRWGHLEVRGEIGRGASGTVYRAWDSRLAREVALKLFAPDAGPGDAAPEEGRLLARLNHPHIVRVFGSDSHDGVAGVWMELLEGDTLDEMVARDGVFGAEETVLIGLDLARALSAVHAAGLLHRDIKAGNVVRERGGRIVLMDLGAGRSHETVARDGDITGTPMYMAPEVLAGRPATVQSDIYCLGVLLFRMLTGSFPVMAADLAGLRARHDSGPRTSLASVRGDLTNEVRTAIERACHPEAQARYSTVTELETALTEALRHTLSRRDPVASAGARTWRRWRSRVLGATAALAMAIVMVLGAWDNAAGRTARRRLGLTVPPRSPLYLTFSGGLAIVRGRQLSIVPNPTTAIALAVSRDLGVRTMASTPPWTTGGAFRLDGTMVASPPTVNDGLCCFRDGATDGHFNYSSRQDSTGLEPVGSRPLAPPALYRFERDWSSPQPLFPLPADGLYEGVAYSQHSRSFWLTKTTSASSVIEQWSREGRRLSAPVTLPASGLLGVAVDPKDDTLWVVRNQYAVNVLWLDNFDTSGRVLGSFEIEWLHPLLPAVGAEFEWIQR